MIHNLLQFSQVKMVHSRSSANNVDDSSIIPESLMSLCIDKPLHEMILQAHFWHALVQ